jgi:SulP family sulfate permease
VLAGAISHDLRPAGEDFVVLRFDASLVFMNVAHFEEAVMDAVAHNPQARAVLILGNSINRIDETGIDKVRSLITDLKAANCMLTFSGLKKPVREAIERAGLLDEIGRENIFPGKGQALETLRRRAMEMERRRAMEIERRRAMEIERRRAMEMEHRTGIQADGTPLSPSLRGER